MGGRSPSIQHPEVNASPVLYRLFPASPAHSFICFFLSSFSRLHSCRFFCRRPECLFVPPAQLVMSSQRYQRVGSTHLYKTYLYRSLMDTDYLQVNAHDEDDEVNSHSSIPLQTAPTPSSPPPSFHSRSSSFSSRRLLQNDPHRSDADQTLADAFGDASDFEGDDEPDDRQRLMRAHPEPSAGSSREGAPSSAGSNEQTSQSHQSSSTLQRRPTILPSFSTPSSGAGRVISSSNDGVFANLAAKPERGEKNEDLPPVRNPVWHQRTQKLTVYSPMKKQLQTPPPRTGRPPSWRPASRPMRFMWMDCRSARSSPSFGTP